MAHRRKLSEDPVVRAVQAHGVADFTRALGYVACWCVVAEQLGHEPTHDEYREWWAASERTAYRERQAFRQVSGLEDPSLIYRRARAAGVEFDRDSASRAGGVALVPFMHLSLIHI